MTGASVELAVRMDMGADVAETVADLLPRLPIDIADRVIDQFWLRSVLIEQWRRTRIAERQTFVERADRLLAALDPAEPDHSRDDGRRTGQATS